MKPIMIIQMMLKMPTSSPRASVDRSTHIAAVRVVAVLAMIVAGVADAAQTCHAVSGTSKTPLVELYTSEGCDSCPPADRWLSAHFPRDGGANRALALAFHVDYWDRLGWTDRFASHAYTERQYAAMHANGKTFVVTPQILLQGHEFPASRRAMPQPALDRIAREPAAAMIELTATHDGKEIAASAVTRIAEAENRTKSTLSIAYVDSG